MSILLMIALQAASVRAATEADARCLAVIGSIDPTKVTPAQRAGLQAGTMYFVGRIDGRSPGTDLKAAIQRALAQGPAVLNPEIKRCSAAVDQRAQGIAAAGAAIDADRKTKATARPKAR